MDDTYEDQVRSTWRRCLIQLVASEYLIYMYENQTTLKQITADKENRSLCLCLRDMLPYILLYPRVLCELKRVVDLSQKNDALSGMRPPPIKIENLFSEMIKGFGSADDEKSVSEEEEFLLSLLNPMRWANPEIVKKKIEEVIHSAGLTKLIESLRNVPGLIHFPDKSLDMGIRDRILNDWAKLTDPKTWGIRIEAHYLYSAVMLELSLEKFKRERDSLTQLGIQGIYELAGSNMI